MAAALAAAVPKPPGKRRPRLARRAARRAGWGTAAASAPATVLSYS